MCSLMAFVLFRVGKEILARRETPVHLELQDQRVSGGLPEMMVPRETLYVGGTNTGTHVHKTVTTGALWWTGPSCYSCHTITYLTFVSDVSAGSRWLPRRPWTPWRAWHSCEWFTPLSGSEAVLWSEVVSVAFGRRLMFSVCSGNRWLSRWQRRGRRARTGCKFWVICKIVSELVRLSLMLCLPSALF